MNFYLVEEGEGGAQFKGVLTWHDGDKLAEQQAHREWRAAQDWFIEYRNNTDLTRHAFSAAETEDVLARCVEVTSDADEKVQHKVTHRLVCYVDIMCSDTVEAFKAKWWNGASTDSRMFVL